MVDYDKLLKALDDMDAEVDKILDILQGDKEMYVKYLVDFPNNTNIIELRKAVEASDAKKAKDEVHTLKGMALNLGIPALADICDKMSQTYKKGNSEAADAMLSEVEKEFSKWSDAIKANS